MRKSLILTLLLLILAAGSFGYIHGSVDASKDAVVIDETVLYGDKVIAEGIKVDLSTHCDYRLFWDTLYTVGEKPEISTTFTFSQAQLQPKQIKPPVFNIYLDDMLSGGGASGYNIDMEAETIPLPVRDVATRTKPGEKHTETVYIKDYYDFYPIRVDFEWPSGFAVNQDTLNLFAGYFKIPVYPKHQVEVSVEKNAAGNVHSIEHSPLWETEVYSHATSVVTDSHCFFTFACATVDGQLLDTSHIPGGYGIYRFPRYTQSGVHILTADELQTVFPLDAERARVIALETSQDKTKLLLVTSEDGDYMLTVIDAVTMTELQKLRIMHMDKEAGPWGLWLRGFYVYEDFIVPISSDSRFALLPLDVGGKYEVRFEGSLSEIKGHEHAFSDELVMSYNGKELAVAAFHYAYNRPRNNCSFYLGVYTNEGLAYAGHYQHSLDKSLIEEYRLICQPLEGTSPRVTWGD